MGERSCSFVHAEDILVFHAEDLLDEHDFVGVQMSLANLNFGQGATGDVTAVDLQLGGQGVLGHAGFFPQAAYIAADSGFDFLIHNSW